MRFCFREAAAASLRWLLVACGSLGLVGCLSIEAPERFAAASPTMRPDVFFAGTTRSWGVIEARSGAPSRVFRVEGRGRSEADGFHLDQTVTTDGKPADHRTWVLRATGPHAYRATLSDAAGEVVGESYGNLFHFRYPLKKPFAARMEQWLYLQPDGITVLNEATITLAGVTLARLSERISRVADPSTGGVAAGSSSRP